MQNSNTRRRPRTAVLGLGATAVSLALALTACSGSSTPGSSSSGSAASKDFSIAFIPKQLNNPYTDVELSGGTSAAKAVGATSSIVGPNDASASSQVSYINTLTQKRVKVIAIAANDPNAVCSSLNQAKAAGAKIITFDSDANCRSIFINQVESKDVALVELKQLHEQLPDGGQIAILSATANATNQNTWIQFMKDELKSNADYKNLDLVTTVYGDDDDTKSFQAAQGLLKSYPNLKGIISPTTVGIAATARYLSKSQYKGKVALVGLGLPKQMRAYIKDGTVKGFALWDPSQIGEAAVYAGKALVAGTITGKEGDSFDAGDLGTLKVGAKGTVIVGPPIEFTADNIDKYHFDDNL
ncbi:rhamnose ABC transporter substrate-binding protein [uncultured Amnibacterium sp.]|uniref:rhamnose ABC transporter substrate-binding protein n=1 Tax=uncultured Amnibacterium sp. TaxID=1631851 RepID=UPI0035C9B8F2